MPRRVEVKDTVSRTQGPTVSTGRLAYLKTLSATDPMTIFSIPTCPCAPITIKSTS